MEPTTGRDPEVSLTFGWGIQKALIIGHNNYLLTWLPHETVSTPTPGTRVLLSSETSAGNKVVSEYRLVE